MIRIARGQECEFEEILDFLDFVFSKNSRPHDFESMYPNLYLRNDRCMSRQICLREDGKLKGCILSEPREFEIGGKRLKVNGIGNVACHPRERGRGFMSKLMTYNNEEMKKDGVHLSELGGNRLRYNNFGYDCGGTAYDIFLPFRSVKKAHPEAFGDNFKFTELKYEDKALVNEIKKLYEQREFHYIYNDYDSFFLRFIIPESSSVTYAVSRDGILLGHLSTRGGTRDRIREISLTDDSLMCDVLFAYSAQTGHDLEMSFAQWQLKYLEKMLRVSDGVDICDSGKWEVLDWQKVIDVLLSFKSTYLTLEKGELIIDITGAEKLSVSYDGEAVKVCPSGKDADITLGALEATGVLTGTRSFVYAASGKLHGDVLRLFRSWFPIPLTAFDTERV